jgi:hypothetical protein
VPQTSDPCGPRALLSTVNSNAGDSRPAVSGNGLTLYFECELFFVSDRLGTRGDLNAMDLYLATAPVSATGWSNAAGGSFGDAGGPGATSTALVTVTNGGSFTSAGDLIVDATGTFDFVGGTLNANGNVTVAGGGTLRRLGTGTFNWAPGKTMTMQSGGRFDLSGSSSVTTPDNATILIQGTNSRLTHIAAVNVSGTSIVNITNGGRLQPGALRVGFVGGTGNVVTVDRALSTLSAGAETIGGDGSAGTVNTQGRRSRPRARSKGSPRCRNPVI